MLEKWRFPTVSFSQDGRLCDTKEYIKPPIRKKQHFLKYVQYLKIRKISAI